jgi:hypothetical protein
MTTALDTPDSGQVQAVERSLYNRMLRNAFIGFFKSAIVAAALGLVMGGIAAAAVSADILPHTLPLLKEGVTGALKIAGWFAGVAGSFGAIAGIQSTRDTRRFFLMHEGHSTAPEKGRGLVLEQEMPEVSTHRNMRFQDRIREEEAHTSQSLQR